jgi:hypothetical protein
MIGIISLRQLKKEFKKEEKNNIWSWEKKLLINIYCIIIVMIGIISLRHIKIINFITKKRI